MDWLLHTLLRSKARSLLMGALLVLLVGVSDYFSGYELSFGAFYLFPVFLVAWVMGQTGGVLISLFSAVVWLAADWAAGQRYSHEAIAYWNAAVRFGFFLAVSFLAAKLRIAQDKQVELAHIDSLTGVANSRSFHERAALEIARARRYHRPLTLAYFDLDNFKSVNDLHGHLVGDSLLQVVAQAFQSQVRATDLLARLGGDEFVLLLTEAPPQAVLGLLKKMQGGLAEVMEKNQWPVTVSIGAATALGTPPSADEFLRKADAQLYEAKRAGKNTIRHEVLPRPS